MASLVIIVMTGATVRLTGSGLGCSDWPTCEDNKLVAPVEFHAQVEFLNRLFTGVVSLSVVATLIGAYRLATKRRDLVLGSWGLVLGVAANGILGGLTVLFELKPIFVIGHFLLSMLLLWNALVLFRRAGSVEGRRRWIPSSGLARLTTATTASAAVVMVAGTVVTGTGPNGGDEEVERLALSLREVARIHSIAAWVLIALAVAVAIRAVSDPTPNPRAVAAVRRLIGLVALQGAIGYVQYFMGVPAAVVGLHVFGSVLVWLAAVDLWLSMRTPVAEPVLDLSDASEAVESPPATGPGSPSGGASDSSGFDDAAAKAVLDRAQ